VEADVDMDNTQYVLITQCLQNDFFLNLDNELCLPEAAAARLLLDANDESGFNVVGQRRELSERSRRAAPLAQFLDVVVGSRISGQESRHLHLINIRDWHVPGEHYDRERTQYGAHCEAGTWGADYLEGFDGYLDPRAHFRAGRRRTASREVGRAPHRPPCLLRHSLRLPVRQRGDAAHPSGRSAHGDPRRHRVQRWAAHGSR